MKVLVLDVNNREVRVDHIEGTLDEFYKIIDCRVIDIVNRRIGNKRYDIICDDEGLLQDDIKVSAINTMHEPMLVGTLIFTLHDEEGETIGLGSWDCEYIKKWIKTAYSTNHPEGHPMLTYCEY